MQNEKICIRCKLGVNDIKFQTPGSKHCIKCANALYYIRNKKAIDNRTLARYYAKHEENKKRGAERISIWRAANPDKVKIENKKKYNKVKADPIKYQKQLKSVKEQKAQKKYNHLEQAYRDRSKENLTDNYIKRTFLSHIVKISYNDISQELVELKRKQLLLNRTIKNQTNVN
jgi:hypothetical protein